MTSELKSQHEAWKAARARLNGPLAQIAAAPVSNIVELVPPTTDPKKEMMDFIVAAVGNVAKLTVNEIIAGPEIPAVISARDLATALCVIRAKIQIGEVADHFEVERGAIENAVSTLRPIYEAHSISHKTPLELSLPLIWKCWQENTIEHRQPRVADIQYAVCVAFGVDKTELLSSRRTLSVVRPRQAAMAIAKHLTTKSLPEIGRRFGGRDHTTVLHSTRKMEPIISAVSERLSRAATAKQWAEAVREELEVSPIGWGAGSRTEGSNGDARI